MLRIACKNCSKRFLSPVSWGKGNICFDLALEALLIAMQC